MEIRKMKWLAYLMVPFIAVAISCKDDDDDDFNNGNGGNRTDGPNEVVLERITRSNLAEIELGTQAASGGEDSLIRAYAQMMINVHNMAQDELDSIAEDRAVDLPSGLNNEHQQLSDSLESLSGSAFDSVYIFSQIMLHTETRNFFQAIIDTTDDQALKDYVNQFLPGVIQHLQKADSIAGVLFGYDGGNDGGNGGNNGGGNDTTGVGNDTTGVGNDTTGVGNDTTGVGNDTTGVGNDTTGVGNDTTGVGSDTTGVGNGDTDGGNEGGTDGGNNDGVDNGTGGTDGGTGDGTGGGTGVTGDGTGTGDGMDDGNGDGTGTGNGTGDGTGTGIDTGGGTGGGV